MTSPCAGARCYYGTCGGGGPNACGGCCACLGGCELEYETRIARQALRTSDRALVRILREAR